MKTILVDAIDAFFVETNGKYQVFEEMHQLLESFPNRKILLTGADDQQFTAWGLEKAPYEVFTLKHNPDKTDPLYYRTLLRHYHLKPEDVVYFEHNPTAVKSAEVVGITTYYYDSTQRDLTKLEGFLKRML